MLVYVLFTFQLVSMAILVYLILHLYQVLSRDARLPRGESLPPGLQKTISEMISELHRTADQINQDLAVRSAVLQRQISEAEHKTAQLDALLAALATAGSQPGTPPNSRSSDRPRPAPASAEAMPGLKSVTEASLSERRANGRSSDTPPPPEPEDVFRPLDLREASKYQQVYRLAEEGLNSLEIAKRTRLGREEVELLLGLHEEGRGVG